MLSKCANPSCSTPFFYLREGKLFQMELPLEHDDRARPELVGFLGAGSDDKEMGVERRPARRVEFFWLCGRCSTSMTLVFEKGRGVVTVPLPPLRRAAAS